MFCWMKGGLESCRVFSVIGIRDAKLEIDRNATPEVFR